MNLRQQIIRDRVENISTQLGEGLDYSFLRLAYSLFTNRSLFSFQSADFVDGGQDKQIDVITIEQSDNEINIYILQVKNEDSFSSNSLIAMHNGLNWIFNKSRSEINKLSNIKFRDKILEVRALQSDVGPSNINVIVGFITHGDTKKIRPKDEFSQEKKSIEEHYDNGTYASFKLLVWGVDELVSQINMLERSERKINADLRIRYDANNPSVIKYYSSELKGLVCTVSAYEIADIVNNDPEGYVFDSNIRKYKGKKGVNKDILKTATSIETAYQFWFLNNGLTIVCDNFDPVTDPDHPHVKIKNMQIVNGCQTATTLAEAAKSGKLIKDTRVVVRIYETIDSSLVDQIVLTTNNQNRITARDLKSNHPTQFDMEKSFLKYEFYYERKPYQYKKDVAVSKIVVNEVVAQSYLAVVLKKISDASRRKYKVWDEYFEEIFAGRSEIEPYIFSYLLYKQVVGWLELYYEDSSDDLVRKLAKTSDFHVSRIAAFYCLGGDNWRDSKKITNLIETYLKSPNFLERKRMDKDFIKKYEENPNFLDVYIDKAFKKFVSLIRNKKKYAIDVENALKSYTLDEDIQSMLYKPKK
ncbi:MAG: AIPR family protein [Anaerolineales bacterium]|nr:AIPR family protein [Anaerolineales bacterium]